MRTQTIRFILAVVIGLSRAQPTVATDYAVTDYLPLAVGNSWTYHHRYSDPDADYSPWSTYSNQNRQLTITVERAEVIDGKTYYVISEMPSNWPPAPSYFIAGKKLRWEGTHLMERTAEGEQALYRFDGTNKAEYAVSTDEGDTLAKVRRRPTPVPMYEFEFHGFMEEGYYPVGRGRFLAGYGLDRCDRTIAGTDVTYFINRMTSLRAVLGGTTVEYEDALIPTSTSSSSWGMVKRSLLAHDLAGRPRR